MAEQTITVSLPKSIYERVEVAAKASSLSLEEVLAQAIALLLPAFENDMPPNIQTNLAALPLSSDIELWKIANSTLAENQQTRLEALAELQKQRPLDSTEQSNLAKLVAEAQQIMLSKAEARRLLAQRGHTVFSASNTPAG